MATPTSAPAQAQAPPVPDLSWFSCITCGRRPVPHASFSMLLTTCSHIVCSSCWNRGGSGECPKCGTKANTLNLSATKQLPKQLEPYYRSPLEQVKKLLRVCEFQEHQKRQTLERRKTAWVLINHQRAKEDFEREYAECKQLLAALNQRKRAVRQIAEDLRRRGIDPVQLLGGAVSASVINSTLGVPPSPATSAPSTPFFPTPLKRAAPSTSTPAFRHGANPPSVEFVEPKRLAHTMRGSVTSKAARRSPSVHPTPLPLQPGLPSHPGYNLPVKRPRVPGSHPSSYGQQPVAMDQEPMDTGQLPVVQSSRRPSLGPDRQFGRPVMATRQPIMQQPVMQPRPMYQPAARYTRSTPYSGQPIARYGQPTFQSGQRVQQAGQVHQIQPARPIIPPPRPVQQSAPPQHTPRSTNTYTPQPHSGGSGSSVRVRAVPASSASQRIFPSPTPSQRSHSPHPHTITPSHRSQQQQQQPPAIPTSSRISLRPTPQSHSGSVRTPTNPSPLLRAFTPQSGSPWKHGRSTGSPWRPGHTPPPGTRLSGSGHSRSRLTPMKS